MIKSVRYVFFWLNKTNYKNNKNSGYNVIIGYNNENADVEALQK